MKYFIISLLALMPLACGTPKSTVKVINKAEGVHTEIHSSVGDGGSTTVTVTPSVSVNVDSTRIL